jgi:hypothetical protein
VNLRAKKTKPIGLFLALEEGFCPLSPVPSAPGDEATLPDYFLNLHQPVLTKNSRHSPG